MVADPIPMPKAVRSEEEPNAPSEAAQDKDSRPRSTIGFPYYDLDSCIQIVQKIHENSGMECQTEQLVGWFKTTLSSGSFKLRLSAAKMFGLIDRDGGSIKLTPLGREILDPSRARDARTRAFLSVPLYKAVHDRYRGGLLPPAPALTNEMVAMGVASKTAERARWTFERSAGQAGFFEHGKDRLVSPATRASAPPQDRQPAEEAQRETAPSHQETAARVQNGVPELHPFVQGLLGTLPQPETVWAVEGRAKWLQAAAHIFDLMYKGDGDIRVFVGKADQRGNKDDQNQR